MLRQGKACCNVFALKIFFPLNLILRLLHQEEIKSIAACHLGQRSWKRDLICEEEVAI